MIALLKMDFLMTKRQIGTVLISIGMTVFFFLIFSSLYMGTLDSAIQARVIKNYLLTMTAFNMSAFGLFTLPAILVEERQNNWVRFLHRSPITQKQYYWSKLVRIMCIFLVTIAVNFVVGSVFKQVALSISDIVVFTLLLLWSSLLYIAIGILLSTINSLQSISVIGNALFFTLAIFGGSWMPIEMFPEWMQSISKLTPTYYINQTLITYSNTNQISLNNMSIVMFYIIILVMITSIIKKRTEVK